MTTELPADPAYRPASYGPPAPPAAAPRKSGGAAKLLIPLAIGGAIAVALGAYGKTHEPTGIAVNLVGFSGPLAAKAWLATGSATLAVVQLFSALAMYGKLGFRAPSWISGLHRWSGRLAFLLAVPVAIHCLYAAAFQTYDTRVLVHSIVGCFFFGAFTTKMLLLPRKGLPGWALPLFGGSVFTALVVLWVTSSLWFFTNVGVTF
jgi:hypothetical protein